MVMLCYNASIRIITPIIIHNGQQYDLWDLMPHPKNPQDLWIINPALAYVSLPDDEKKKFDAIVDEMSNKKGENIKEKMNMLRNMLHSRVINNPSIIVNQAKALENFFEELEKNPHAEIRKIYKEPLTNRCYIPGSSVKGMIRTAVLEAIRKKKNLIPKINLKTDVRRGKVNIKAALNFEDIIMLGRKRNKVYDDPFKFLHVSDFIIEKTDTIFGTIRVTSRRAKIPVYTEMTGCELLQEKEYIAKGSIVIYDNKMKRFFSEFKEEELAGKDKYDVNALKIIQENFKGEFILDALKNFYDPLLNNTKHPVNQEIKKCMNKYTGNWVPVRLGRFSQVESKTFKVERTWERGDSIRMNFEGGQTRAYVKGTIGAGWGLMSLTKV